MRTRQPSAKQEQWKYPFNFAIYGLVAWSTVLTSTAAMLQFWRYYE